MLRLIDAWRREIKLQRKTRAAHTRRHSGDIMQGAGEGDGANKRAKEDNAVATQRAQQEKWFEQLHEAGNKCMK